MSQKTKTPEDARREYLREWRRKNKDKVKGYQISYWIRRAEREGAEKNGTNEK